MSITSDGITDNSSAVLNPKSRYYNRLKEVLDKEYEDNYWPEDAVFLERNSRDFVSRNDRINHNAEAVCELLRNHQRGRQTPVPCELDRGC